MEIEIEIEGLRLAICQGAYPPSEDTYLLLDEVGRRRAVTALEVGSGTGLVALKIASNGSFTVASDIDPKAAHCTKLNAKRNGLSSLVDVTIGDLMSHFRDRCFDLIAFNPPYLPVNDRDVRWSGGSSGREVSNRFINEVHLKLKPEGVLLLVQSTLSGVSEAISKLKAKGLQASVIRAVKVGLFEEVVLIEALRLNLEQDSSKAPSE
ncbi:MAG: methyltransferase [Candidatus Nezhaarchaeota archaeon]|nr:methyltransferase [Candidatus Nezhaarchaeota archaeon]